MQHPDDWLSRKEAADYGCVSLATLDRAIKDGRLRAKKVNGSRRVVIRRRWVDAYLLAALVLALLLLTCLMACVADAAQTDSMSWLGLCPC